jgi:hypothetical protein
MSSKDYNGYSDHDSIFDNSEGKDKLANSLLAQHIKDVEIKDDGIVARFFESVSAKLSENKSKKIQKEAEKILSDSTSFFQLLYDFGCSLIYDKDFIEIYCEQINIKGKITVTKDKEFEFDENAKEILTYIANVINRSNSLHDIISKYEEQGFYPIGELKKETAIINGNECEVLVGTLENDKKEQKTIYYYNGNELFLGEN